MRSGSTGLTETLGSRSSSTGASAARATRRSRRPAQAFRPVTCGRGSGHGTHAALKTIAALLNTEGGDLLIGVDDNRRLIGIGHDRLDTDDKFMLYLAQTVRNGLGDRAGTCIDPKTQTVGDKTVCIVSCQRSPEPVYLQWKGLEKAEGGDFYVRSGPDTVRLTEDDARKYVANRFGATKFSPG